LVGRWIVNAGESNVKELDNVPTIPLTEITVGSATPIVALAMQTTEVLETHALDMHVLPPIPTVAVSSMDPKLTPRSVSCAPPVVATLLG
jgi:hypothetical protein